MGSSDDWAPLGVKTRIFVPEKGITCLDLGCYHPIFNKGCWGLDTCGSLISGLRGRIVWVSFFWDVATSLTTVVRLWRLQHFPISCVVSLPTVTVQDVVCQL